jgi:hypothetical protein
VNVETKEQSKQWKHTHSLNKRKIWNKRCLPDSWCQLFSGVWKGCWRWNSRKKGPQ